MEPIFDQEIKFITWLQSLGDWLLPFALIFSLLGSEFFVLFLAPVIYWCYDPILGIRTGIYLLISSGLNTILKVFFHSPRPYWYSTDVKALSAESSFGEPSGHAQSSVIIWGTIALYIRKRWVWILSIVMIFFISLSRVYLAVHFPTDILLGWIIGILLLWLLVRFEDPFLNWFKKFTLYVQVIFIFLVSLSFIVIFLFISFWIGNDVVVQAWIDTAAKGIPGALPIDPLSIKGIFTNAGALLGTGIGAIWISKRSWFSTHDKARNLTLRFIIGLIGVIILRFGLDILFPDGQEFIHLVLRYFRYALTALWITGAAPMLFIKLGLAHPGINS